MSMVTGRRSRKRATMREGISDAAMRLFAEKGFDRVTVDEIAEAADVGRKTVFNYFPRKDDLFFDRLDEIREILKSAVQQRAAETSPLEAYRLLGQSMVETRSPYLESSPESLRFMEAIEESETLQARARLLRDEFVELLSASMAEAVGRDRRDPDAYFAASLLVATWTAARMQAHRTFLQSQSHRKARAAFLTILNKGAAGLEIALSGTPYVDGSQQRPSNVSGKRR